jgi:hypothetical protein
MYHVIDVFIEHRPFFVALIAILLIESAKCHTSRWLHSKITSGSLVFVHEVLIWLIINVFLDHNLFEFRRVVEIIACHS